MVILVAYSAWVYPFEVAFMDARPKGGLEVADMVVDIFFAVDIVLTFFVAYIDSRTQLLVRDRRRITFRYVRSTAYPPNLRSTCYLVRQSSLLLPWSCMKERQLFVHVTHFSPLIFLPK